MRWLRRRPPLEEFVTAAFLSPESVRWLIVARLEHRAGPEWHDRYGDPLTWLEQIYYDLQDDTSRAHFATGLIDLLDLQGARWAALNLVRQLRLRAAAPTLLRLGATGELRGVAEGPTADLHIAILVTLEELGVPEAMSFLQSQLDDPTYAVSAYMALLDLNRDLAIPHLPSVAVASSQAAEGTSGMLGTIGSVLASTLRDKDTDTFLAMVRTLQNCDRSVRVHAAEALRRQSELDARPDLEAEARRLLLGEAK